MNNFWQFFYRTKLNFPATQIHMGFNQFLLPFIKFVSSNCNIFDNAPDSEFKIYPKNWDTKLTAAFISANMD